MRRFGLDMAFGSIISDNHWQEMVANGLAFIIFRAGQRHNIRDDVAAQVAQANRFHVPYSFYHWMEPGIPALSQVDNMMGNVQRYAPKSIFLDFEQREGHYGRGDYMAPDAIDAAYHAIFDLVHTRTTLPIMVYSGWWFVDEYAPNMKTWIGPWWNASYRRFNPITWPDFQAQLAARIMPSYAGYPPVVAWQYAGDCWTPVVNHYLDYNLIDDDAWFAHLFQDAPAPLPPPPPPVTVAYRVTNPPNGTFLQSQPSWSAAQIRWLATGTLLQVDEGDSFTGWKRVIPAGWVDARRVVRA